MKTNNNISRSLDNTLQNLDKWFWSESLPKHGEDGYSLYFHERVEMGSETTKLVAQAIGDSNVCWILDGMNSTQLRGDIQKNWANVRPQIFRALKQFAKTGKGSDINWN